MDNDAPTKTKKEKILTNSMVIHTFLAIALSWTVNKSILWAIFHALMGGFYVLFWFIKYSKLENIIMGLMK